VINIFKEKMKWKYDIETEGTIVFRQLSPWELGCFVCNIFAF